MRKRINSERLPVAGQTTAAGHTRTQRHDVAGVLVLVSFVVVVSIDASLSLSISVGRGGGGGNHSNATRIVLLLLWTHAVTRLSDSIHRDAVLTMDHRACQGTTTTTTAVPTVQDDWPSRQSQLYDDVAVAVYCLPIVRFGVAVALIKCSQSHCLFLRQTDNTRNRVNWPIYSHYNNLIVRCSATHSLLLLLLLLF